MSPHASNLNRRGALAALTAVALLGWTASPASAQEETPPPLAFEAGSETLAFASDDIGAVTVHRGAAPEGVNLEVALNSDARERFARFTAVHLNQSLAVFLGGEAALRAVIRAPITSGRITLPFSNQPTAAKAMDLILGRAPR